MIVRSHKIIRLLFVIGLIVTLRSVGYSQAFDVSADCASAATSFSCTLDNANVANRVIILPMFVGTGLTNGTAPEVANAAPTYNSVSGTVVNVGGCTANPVYTNTTFYGARVDLYYLIAPSTGSHSATFGTYPGTASYKSGIPVTVNGAHQTAPIIDCNITTVNDSNGATSISVTCANALNGNLMLLWISELSTSGTFSTPTGGGIGTTVTLRTTGTGQTGNKTFFYTAAATGSFTFNPSVGAAKDVFAVCMAIKAPVSVTANNNGLMVQGAQ